MKFNECLPMDETFTFVAHDGSGASWHLNASALMRDLISGKVPVKPELAELEPEFLQHLLDMHGVEMDRVERMKQEIVSGVPHPPALIVQWQGYDVLADGNHRVVAAGLLGHKRFPAYIVPTGQWEAYLVEDVPQFIADFALADTVAQWEKLSPEKKAEKYRQWQEAQARRSDAA